MRLWQAAWASFKTLAQVVPSHASLSSCPIKNRSTVGVVYPVAEEMSIFYDVSRGNPTRVLPEVRMAESEFLESMMLLSPT